MGRTPAAPLTPCPPLRGGGALGGMPIVNQDGIRFTTCDLDHGAIALYHLSYARINLPQVPADGIEPPLS